jgi:hypothetical protein
MKKKVGGSGGASEIISVYPQQQQDGVCNTNVRPCETARCHVSAAANNTAERFGYADCRVDRYHPSSSLSTGKSHVEQRYSCDSTYTVLCHDFRSSTMADKVFTLTIASKTKVILLGVMND